MKTAIRIIAAGLAASLALVSCAKQDVIDNGSTSPADGVRTIAVSFANASVKSELGEDGLTPKFLANDVIKVSNGTTAEECIVSTDGGNASITTELTGSLTMVYPATAAKMNDNAIDGILVPTVQDGTFASANICKATIAADATSATFENQTAVFKVTPPSGVKKFTITSLKPIVDGVARTGTPVAINTEGADDAAKLVITVGGDASELTTFYVSLVAGVNLTDLSFEYKTDETHGAMKGIPAKSIQAPVVDKTAASTLYTIDANNWHEYVVLEGKKWATMNVGATTPKEYGEYFFWAGTVGYVLYGSNWVTADGGVELPGGFNWVNTPYQTQNTTNQASTKYTKYLGSTSSSYKDEDATDADALKTVLDLEDDAACANWGGTWRMPTGKTGEFAALKAATYWKWEDGGYYVYTPYSAADAGKINSEGTGSYEKSSHLLFFPAAGMGSDTSLSAVSNGKYWTSILRKPYDAWTLDFQSIDVSWGNTDRRYGCSVRPVSD